MTIREHDMKREIDIPSDGKTAAKSENAFSLSTERMDGQSLLETPPVVINGVVQGCIMP